MDGNGRWAKNRGLSRSQGHRAGAEAVIVLLESALEYKIKVISLYAFSTENWKRPASEVKSLFEILNFFIEKNLSLLLEKKIRLIVSGDLKKLPAVSRRLVKHAQEATQKGKALTLNFCLNYGSKQEILRAIPLLMAERQKNNKDLLMPVTEKEFANYLYTAKLPMVDLLIRTAGEKRLSNFLLFQSAYAEIIFTNALWPDFNREEFIKNITEYQTRIRKFGGLLEES